MKKYIVTVTIRDQFWNVANTCNRYIQADTKYQALMQAEKDIFDEYPLASWIRATDIKEFI